MPELPEVETVRRGLAQRAAGRKVAEVKVLNPSIVKGSAEMLCQALPGRTIGQLHRKGKALGIEFRSAHGQPSCYLLVRLGMTGQLVVTSQDSPLLPHTHLRLAFEDGREELRFRDPRRFGLVRCCRLDEIEAIYNAMGPDALEISKGYFMDAIKGRRGAIKGWLLNQAMLAGMGNIYADEALFLAGIHPQTPAGRINPAAARRLHRAVIKVLRRSVRLQGTSFRDYINIEGKPGNFSPRLQVYQRTGEPCRKCGAAVRRVIVCGRSSHFCPRCQLRPRKVAPPGTTRKTAAGVSRRAQGSL
jgi:formamidopyrimidine-DNA glycosylase